MYLGQLFGDSTLVQEQTSRIDNVLSVDAAKVEGGVVVTLRNVGAGHDFPTGVTDIRQPWVQIEVKDGDGGAAATYGGLDDTGTLPSGAARLGIDLAAADGTPLLEHQLTLAARVPYDVRIPPGEAQSLFVPTPAFSGSADAVVMFGVVRSTYYRAAVEDAGAAAPAVEIARAAVR